MTTSDAIVAPALSTTQDEDIEFSKVDEGYVKEPRLRFGPKYATGNSVPSQVISEYYSLDKLADYLRRTDENEELKYSKIALQFPDNLVQDSALVCQLLQDLLLPKQTAWILADTSYSPCCVDEVAAGHVGADMVVHFGDACLNPVQRTRSAYIFGRPYMDVDKTLETFSECYSDHDAKVALMADTEHSYLVPQLYKKLKTEYPNIVYADVDFHKCYPKGRVIDQYDVQPEGYMLRDLSRVIHGLKEDEDDTQEYDLFYIGAAADAKLLLLATKFNNVTTVDPETLETSTGCTPSLMKRYRFMMTARNASTIGILVNTLSLENTNALVNQVAAQIKEAGKKHYLFVVGKPNVAKLANFETIDVWCVLGCGQSGIIIDQYNEYFKPIVTPYELELALMPEITWTGKWVTDFKEVLKQEDNEGDNEGENEDEKKEEVETKTETEEDDASVNGDDDDEFKPEFDPVTGKLVAARPLRQLKHLEIELGTEAPQVEDESDSKELIKKFSSQLTVGNTISTSALHLQNRTWTGLGSDFPEDANSDEGAELEQGRTGVARGYDYDRENAK